MDRRGPLITVVAAHPDDAAFSIGGFLLRIMPGSAALVTCFCRSWLLGEEEIISQKRAEEEKAFAAFARLQLTMLGLPDTSTRNAGVDARLELSALLKPILSKTLIFSPLGVGNHQDHIHCREAIAELVNSKAIVFYEDLPYAGFAGGPKEVAAYASQNYPLMEPFTIFLTKKEMKRKLQGMEIYKTQLHPSWREAIVNYASQLAGDVGEFAERFWAMPEARKEIANLLNYHF